MQETHGEQTSFRHTGYSLTEDLKMAEISKPVLNAMTVGAAMPTIPKSLQAAMDAATIKPFISVAQLAAMGEGCWGEEASYFYQKFREFADRIHTMPVTYEQDGKGDLSIVSLHYFYAGSDWFILEKDIEGGVEQAFGYAILNGDVECAELGYISIEELVSNGVELDLHFEPCTLLVVKKSRASQTAIES